VNSRWRSRSIDLGLHGCKQMQRPPAPSAGKRLTHAKFARQCRVQGVNSVTLDGKCVQSGVESFKKHSDSAPTSTPPGRAVSWRTFVPAISGSPGTYSNPAILDFGSSTPSPSFSQMSIFSYFGKYIDHESRYADHHVCSCTSQPGMFLA